MYVNCSVEGAGEKEQGVLWGVQEEKRRERKWNRDEEENPPDSLGFGFGFGFYRQQLDTN